MKFCVQLSRGLGVHHKHVEARHAADAAERFARMRDGGLENFDRADAVPLAEGQECRPAVSFEEMIDRAREGLL